MQRALILAIALPACGARTTLDATPLDATIDVTVTSDAADDVREASACTKGTEYVEVIDDTGVHVISGGCGDAGVPSASIGSCSDKVFCLYVEACGDASIELESIVGWNPGKHGAIGWYPHPDASTVFYTGTIDVADWPDSGGTVEGDYHVMSQNDASIAGTFCVRRL